MAKPILEDIRQSNATLPKSFPPRPSLSDDAYFSPVPSLLIDMTGRIADANIAFDVWLGGSRSDIWRGRFYADLSNELNSEPGDCPFPKVALRLLQGNSDPTAIFSERGVCHSPRFGKISFSALAMLQGAPERRDKQVIACYWHLELIDHALFLEDLNNAMAHELTWAQYALSYDRILLEMPYYRQVLRRHLQALRSSACERIADLGTGTGNLAQRLLRDGQQVVAVDASRAMLSRLLAKPFSQDSRLAVYHQSAESLPNLTTETFDGINILLVLYNVARPARVLNEAIRLLRPGGLIVITEPRRKFNMDLILDRCRRRLCRTGKQEELSIDFKRVTDANKTFDPTLRDGRLCAEDVLQILRDRQFDDVAFRPSHYGQCAMVIGRKPCV